MNFAFRPKILVENPTLLARLRKLQSCMDLYDMATAELAEMDIILSDRQLPNSLIEQLSADGRIVGLLHHGVPIVRSDVLPDAMVSADISPDDLQTVIFMLADLIRLRRNESISQATERKLRDLAYTDSLTGLPNRRAWDDQLRRVEDSPAEICIALIDVDFFKHVNETDGHAVGDDVLREVGLAMRQHLRENDFVARLGGDEFGLLISHVDSEIAQKIVDRIRVDVARHLAENDFRPVTLSAGYIFAGANSTRIPSDLYRTATLCLRKAKQSNRDCTVGHVVGPTEEG